MARGGQEEEAGMARAQGGREAGYRGLGPPPVAPGSWKRRIFVERPAELAALAERLATAHLIAIDAEFAQPRLRSAGEPPHRLALLQIAIDDGYEASYVVDTLRLANLSPLAPPLANGAILKLFHGIGADARVLATRDLYARHTLDLEAVSRSIFGQRESGLQAMLQRACGIRLDKTLQRADWGHRPLTPAMIAYAARDAEMTFVLYDWLRTHYPPIVAAHEIPAESTLPDVADWMLPILESTRMRSVESALADTDLSAESAAHDLAQALGGVTHPAQRARLLRAIGELGLMTVAPVVRPFLAAVTTEERAGAARALGRIGDWQSQRELEALLHDPVEDVRQAAETALEALKKGPQQPAGPRRPRTSNPLGPSGGPRSWTIEGERTGAADEALDPNDWRAALRQRFPVVTDDDEASGADDSDAGSSTEQAGAANVPAPDEQARGRFSATPEAEE
jgi:hypothetical protein